MTAPRFDMYRQIHKAMRAAMSEAMLAAGRMDPDDDGECAAVAAQARDLVHLARMHLAKEDKFVHPAMEARAPGSSGTTAGDHLEHARAFIRLEATVDALEQAAPGHRAGAADALYSELAMFAGENFVHMHVEETENNAVFWRTHSDAELLGIERAIVASLSPEEKMASGRWMLPNINPAERAEKLLAMRPMMPPEVFNGALAMVRAHISPAHWAKLQAALGQSEKAA